IGNLAPGASAVVTVVVTPTVTGPLTTSVSAAGKEVDPNLVNNTASAATTAINLPGTLQFAAPAFSVSEAGKMATITVTRSGGTLGAVTVNFLAGTGTGRPGVDYTPTSGTLQFANGETTKTFKVPVFDSGQTGPNHTVNLFLVAPTGGAKLGAQS